MFFKNIPYKAEEKLRLIAQASGGRIPHAQLFIGSEGSSSLALTLAYISYIFCSDKQTDDSCGICANCKVTHKYVHPDVHFSFPVVKKEDKKREDTTSDDFLNIWRPVLCENYFLTMYDWQHAINAQTTKPNINTKECNDIIHKLAFQSFGDGPKVLLMWMPEYLGKEGNKLLKLIEEPTDNTYIILVAQDQNRILSTILSRCQLMKFLPYKDEEIKQFLIDEYGLDDTIALQYARLSEGNIAKAVSMSKNGDTNYSDVLFDWLRVCYKGDGEEMLNTITGFSQWTLDLQIKFLEYGLHFLQTFHNWISSDDNEPNMTAKEVEVATKMKNIIDKHKLELLTEVLNNAIFHLNRNGNVKLNLMADSIVIGDILRNNQQAMSNRRIFVNESLLVQ
jgi:DNA polymerase III subunit delta'